MTLGNDLSAGIAGPPVNESEMADQAQEVHFTAADALAGMSLKPDVFPEQQVPQARLKLPCDCHRLNHEEWPSFTPSALK